MPVGVDDLRAARARIAPHLVRTPLERSALAVPGASELLLKLESRQRTGSFKARGALNKMLLLGEAAKTTGVVTASAGNHALGIAFAASVIGGVNAALFVQKNASPAKIDRLRRFPVEVRLVGDDFEEAQQAALAHSAKTGATFVSAYDDPDVLAGQGTVGLEIAEDAGDVDVVVVPTGGGALLAGIALAVKSSNPHVRVIGVNPDASPSALRSLEAGHAIDPFEHGPTLAYALAGGFGRTAFDVARSLVDGIVLVSDDEIARATAALFDADTVVAEPSGVAAVAAVLAGKIQPAARRVVAVVSGGNVDAATYAEVLARGAGRVPVP